MPAVRAANTSAADRPVRRRLSQMQVIPIWEAIMECILIFSFSVINFISVIVKNNEYFMAIY